MAAEVERVGLANLDEVGLINVPHDSCIVLTPDGEAKLFMAEGISKRNVKMAQKFHDSVMLFVNDPHRTLNP